MEILDHGPFKGLRGHNLTASELSTEQKCWLGEQIHSKLATLEMLHKHCGIKKNTLKKYATLTRKGIKPQCNAGKPLIIAETEMGSLISAISNEKRLKFNMFTYFSLEKTSYINFNF
jgi:hypothetical protein